LFLRVVRWWIPGLVSVVRERAAQPVWFPCCRWGNRGDFRISLFWLDLGETFNSPCLRPREIWVFSSDASSLSLLRLYSVWWSTAMVKSRFWSRFLYLGGLLACFDQRLLPVSSS
uniref:Uncharacterized protein n=1 Tax=Oryza brachyantha TaxID=4533 RepID=J3MFH4_ORYBR